MDLYSSGPIFTFWPTINWPTLPTPINFQFPNKYRSFYNKIIWSKDHYLHTLMSVGLKPRMPTNSTNYEKQNFLKTYNQKNISKILERKTITIFSNLHTYFDLNNEKTWIFA